MENIFDIKRKKNLNFILPLNEEVFISRKVEWKQVIIVIYLFYESTLDYYLKYIKKIPIDIHILFVTSNLSISNKLKDNNRFHRKNCKIIKKKNRGRDVSALLVTCRKEILKYKYVCFLHDKMWKDQLTKQDTKLFIKCLWENMVGSEIYIQNIIRTLEQNNDLGVLLPPEPISDHFSYLFQNTWGGDFEIMQELALKLNLNCNLDKNKKPLSVGTVFWAKVEALKKLFIMEWKYEDFDEEPLKDDGTISHCLERCFGYVAQDVNYNTGIVMTDYYAGKRLDYMQDILTEVFEQMEVHFGISTIYELRRNKLLYNELSEFMKKHFPVYIYGAGKCAYQCIKLLHSISYNINSFLVSSNEKNLSDLEGVPVRLFSEFIVEDNSGIIIAVKDKGAKKEIEKVIKQKYPLYNEIFYFG